MISKTWNYPKYKRRHHYPYRWEKKGVDIIEEGNLEKHNIKGPIAEIAGVSLRPAILKDATAFPVFDNMI